MSALVLVVPDAAAMEDLGRRLAAHLRPGDVVMLEGELGAGKTTLTRGIGEGLGIRGRVASPTFVLARTHPRPGGVPFVHVDAYRLAGARELDDLDLDLDGAITVVEWGAGKLAPDSYLALAIDRPTGAASPPAASDASNPDPDPEDARPADPDAPDEPRRVTVTAHGPRWPHPPAL